MIKNKNFQSSLRYCKGLIVLTEYMRRKLYFELKKIKYNNIIVVSLLNTINMELINQNNNIEIIKQINTNIDTNNIILEWCNNTLAEKVKLITIYHSLNIDNNHKIIFKLKHFNTIYYKIISINNASICNNPLEHTLDYIPFNITELIITLKLDNIHTIKLTIPKKSLISEIRIPFIILESILYLDGLYLVTDYFDNYFQLNTNIYMSCNITLTHYYDVDSTDISSHENNYDYISINSTDTED